MNELESNISKMQINGNRLELPKDEVFKNYALVKKTLVKAGGKYVKNGFVFSGDVEELKARLSGGEKIDDKKKYQFFETPPKIAKLIIELAEIDSHDTVLEPSVGRGAIIKYLPKVSTLQIVELMPENCKALESQGYLVINEDFLTLTTETLGGYFDKIVANPPFTNNQDIDHIMHMGSMLSQGGILVSVSSNSWRSGSMKKQIAFRDWLASKEHKIVELAAGEFKESGTSIATNIVVIYN